MLHLHNYQTNCSRWSIRAGPSSKKPPKTYVANEPTLQNANLNWIFIRFQFCSFFVRSSYLLRQQLVREPGLRHLMIDKFPAPFLSDRFGHIRTLALSCTWQRRLWLKLSIRNENFIGDRTLTSVVVALTNGKQDHASVQKFTISGYANQNKCRNDQNQTENGRAFCSCTR